MKIKYYKVMIVTLNSSLNISHIPESIENNISSLTNQTTQLIFSSRAAVGNIEMSEKS